MSTDELPAGLDKACDICIEALTPTDPIQRASNLEGLASALAHYDRDALMVLVVALAGMVAHRNSTEADA
jgi:hypothetical protein